VHDVASVSQAVELAREAGFENVSLDLIFGAAGESVDDWRRSLDTALALAPTHVSAYALTIEPGTPLAHDAVRHPDSDDQADKYLLADEVLGAAGYEWYEISNWARPGYECRHNLLYWMQGDYRGIGCAAHSHAGGLRWWNLRTPDRYIAAVRGGCSVVAASETLDSSTRALERLQLSLRTRLGVPADALDVASLPDDVVIPVEDRFVLTPRGRLLANEIAAHLSLPHVQRTGGSTKDWPA
jgi:oxygen-independent coproporphyrinogen-3 oxidase